MGSGKGQSQSNQNQTYTPNAQAGSYITDALSRAQQTANLPFNVPQAPVAGFSGQQQQAFNQVGASYNQAQPYFQQAGNYFNQSANPDIASFYNPMAQNVTNQLQNIFGQQNQQNTGDLVKSAGGVGADRIAVGQANMANQQGLAAGQTYANLYQQAVQAAQTQQQQQRASGASMMSLGQNAQNASLQGANALLGTGGLQQQLQQAQLNAPYQQQVAQAAFPYQQSQYYASLVGALAPGLGGTTTGQTTNTPAQPSMWSQILGGAGVGTALLGQSGAFGGQGWMTGSSPSYGGGNIFSGDAYGGSASNPTPGLSASDYGAGYAEGGAASDDQPGGVSDKPIDISSNPFIPKTQLTPIQAHIPQLQQPQQQSGGGGGGPGIGDVAKMAMMFLNRGGTVPGYDEGGDVINPDEPFRMPDQSAVNDWRRGVATDMAEGRTEQPTEEAVPMPRARPGRMTASAAPPDRSTMAFAGSPDASSDLPPEISGGNSYAPQRSLAGEGAPSGGGSENPFSIPISNRAQERQDSFANSPWAALMSAGLGIMGGTSPFTGVNIGQGGQQGLKTLQQQQENAQKEETIAQAAKRLALEAKFHEDQYNRETVGQRQSREQAARPYEQLTAAQKWAKEHQETQDELKSTEPVQLGTDKNGYPIMGVRDPEDSRKWLDPATNQPIDARRFPGGQAPTAGAGATAEPTADGVVRANTQAVAKGSYDYSTDAPYIEKGMDVPEPEAIGGKSARALQTDAEMYLQTGKLPPVSRGKSPVAIQQQKYRDAVQNYGNAVASSRGLAPEQVADMWRSAPGMTKFILGADGRATVSLGTAVRHLDTMKQLAAAWQANDMPAVNRIRATISREFGADAATNLDAAGHIVGPEIIKAIGVAGAGTAEERQKAADSLSAARSPQQIIGAVETVQKLLGGQLEGKRRQAAAAGVSEEKFKGLIGDRPYEILSSLEKSHGASGSTAPEGAQKTISRQGTVNSGPNKGKTVVEYSDGTREYK